MGAQTNEEQAALATIATGVTNFYRDTCGWPFGNDDWDDTCSTQ